MLQAEMSKVRKKIDMTQKKTFDIKKQQAEREKGYIQRMQLAEIKEASYKPNFENMERKKKLQEEIKEKRFKMFLNKRKEVNDFKKQRMEYQVMKQNLRHEIDVQNQERKHLIRE